MPLVPVYGSTGALRTPCAAPRGARGARDGTLRRARLRGAPGGCACGAGGAARLLQARANPAAAPAPPRLRGLATAPRLAPATPRRRAPPLGASSRVPPVGLGRAGGGRCKGCAWAASFVPRLSSKGRRSARLKRQLCWNEFSAREILEMPACRRHRPPRAPLACAQPPR